MEKKYSIVYVDMVADMFHINHVKFLKKCNEMCDFLYVGIHSDKSVEKYKRKPIMNMKERVGVVESCKYVNKIIENAPITPSFAFLKKHNIVMVIHAHSKEEEGKYNFMYSECVKENKFMRIDYQEGISTTEIINRIKTK